MKKRLYIQAEMSIKFPRFNMPHWTEFEKHFFKTPMKTKFDVQELQKLRAFTVQQAAFYAATSRDVVLRWLNSGNLGCYVLPNTSSKKVQRRILREELDQFLEAQYRKTKPRKSEYLIEYHNRQRPNLILLPKEKCDTASHG